MGVRAAQDLAPEHARQNKVINIDGLPRSLLNPVSLRKAFPYNSVLHAFQSPRALSEILSCCQDGLNNLYIAGAAAEIARDRGPDLLLCGLRLLIQEGLSNHEHARDAKATLDCSILDERLLQGVKLHSLRQPLDCSHLSSTHVNRQSQAGANRPTVQKHGTDAALPDTAAVLCSGKGKILPNHLEKSSIWLEL